jgi:DNA-directed RNA polymerase subunit N (RpoN/RPB10)
MLYPVCPTCGHLLADIEVEFTDKYNLIINGKAEEEKKEKDITKLFEEYKVKKYCCKMRLITYFEHINHIQ